MSDELRLPDDLAAIEARLASHSPPASGIGRDELMYRAGWAACEANRAVMNPPPLKGGARGGILDAAISATASAETTTTVAPLTQPLHSGERGRIAAWSLASAALAASLAVVATLQLQGERPHPQTFAQVGEATRENGTTETAPTESAVAHPAAVADYLAGPTPRRLRGRSVFAMGRTWDDVGRLRPLEGNSVAHSEPSPPPKTARQLRNELLPRRTTSTGDAAPASGWPWGPHLWGSST